MHWVKPELVARVKFGQWTHDKRLRAPVFLGFQEDRAASDCRFDNQVTPAVKAVPENAGEERKAARQGKAKKGKEEKVATSGAKAHSKTSSAEELSARDLETELVSGRGESLAVDLGGKRVNLTHMNKIYFPEDGLRKRDVLLHYLRVAPQILPFLKDRPLVLKRYPNGIDEQFFFQKEATSAPDWIRTVEIDSKERRGKMPYFLADDLADLLYLTNLGCIDHNPWSSRFDNQDHPDYVFFDLDPTDGTSFDVVLKVARAIYKQLESLKVRVYMKTSGASGFHMFIPLEPEYTYEEVRLFAGAIGQRVQAELPTLVTSERTVSKRRKGTVLIDALQNAKGKPLASVYSLRPFRVRRFPRPRHRANLPKDSSQNSSISKQFSSA